jgi:hypothetical protein
MLRAITKLLSLSVTLVIGIVVILLYREHSSVERHSAELEVQNNQLHQIVDRLTDEHRVARMMVISRKKAGGVGGLEQNTVLFMEYARNGTTLPPRNFVISGNQVHLDAMVIKFQHDFVKQNDPLRGHSLALFTRIYGNGQSPDQGTPIDTPGQIPGYYQGTDDRVSAYETSLWNDFWKLAIDPDYRDKMGVRVSNGQGLWWPLEPERLYTVTIESDGGLNVISEPIEGFFREALKQKAAGN